jgi:large subunit ribosomal protein L5
MKFQPLQERLKGKISESLKEKLGRDNPNSLPGIEKVTVNVGINKGRMDGSEMLDYVVESLKQITGQKPAMRTANKSVSNFKIREGMIVGAQVTMRGKNMYNFLDRLIHIALPRVRDFRGVKTKFDGHGNYSMGIIEHTVFPEVPLPDASKVFGFQVTITTTADTDEEAIELLKGIGMPFRKKGDK